MGMFDHLYVEDLSLLPLTDSECGGLTATTEWQTKSLDCLLTCVYLTPDKRLEVLQFDMEEVPQAERPYPDDDGIMGIMGSIRRVNEERVDINYHGYLNFYTGHNGDWLEFTAKFTDGIMVEIIRVSPPDASDVRY